MSKELTDAWKADRLQPGRYWVKNTKGGIMPDVYMANREWMYSRTEYVEEVLASCDYEELQQLKEEKDKWAYQCGKSDAEKWKSQRDNKQLRALLKECKDWMYWAYAELYEYDPEHESKDTEKLISRVEAAIGESEER